MRAVFIKWKNCFLSQSIYFFNTMFLFTFWIGQVHKDSKLGIMTYVGRRKLVKIIFTNIHMMSNTYANRFARYII